MKFSLPVFNPTDRKEKTKTMSIGEYHTAARGQSKKLMMNDASSDADGEIIAMTIECLQKSGLKEFKVDIGHADIFRGLIDQITFVIAHFV